jgi:hypothetical protein
MKLTIGTGAEGAGRGSRERILDMAIAGEQAVSERNSARFKAIRKMAGDGLVIFENVAVAVNYF